MPYLTKDRLTELPNFLALTEDFPAISSQAELFIGFDLPQLEQMDQAGKSRGREGAVRHFASALVQTKQQTPGCIRAYRIGDYEFLLACAAGCEETASSLVAQVDRRFRMRLDQAELPQVSLRHTVITSCRNTNASPLGNLLSQLHLGLAGAHREGRNLAHEPAAHLVDWMLCHVSRTLQSLHEARSLAATDDISGLPNYREARRRFAELLATGRSLNQCFSVLFVDGDNLRTYNEVDYDAGNRMIRHLGRRLSNLVRVDDFVARWLCGDEFIILLPKASREVAQQVAERLRVGVAEAFEDWPFPVTVSIGIACCPADGTTLEELTRRMTLAAAEAKSLGKNRVV